MFTAFCLRVRPNDDALDGELKIYFFWMFKEFDIRDKATVLFAVIMF
jgi:hypothetical protein